jgi:hypothetical protein
VSKNKRRVVIRLKHSLLADEEINTVLPDKLDELEAAYTNGELKKFVVAANEAQRQDDGDSDGG